MSYVQIQQVSKRYNHTHVLNDISFNLNQGEMVTLLGPSGCGKSTLLRAIAGLIPLEQGTIMVNDKDITHLPPQKREVAMVFQSYALFPNMNVFDNIAFGLKMNGVAKSDIHTRVRDMIELVDLNGKEKSYPRELSGGQQQRVALARSLVVQPKILLLDEPLSALDAKIRKLLQAELRRIQQKLKMTTIFVTHDQEEAMTVSDRIYILNEGKIAQHGTPQEMYTAPKNEFVARFIGNYNVFSAVEWSQLSGTGIDAAVIGIRPEVIQLEQSSDNKKTNAYYIDGTITDVMMIGSIRRYKVEKNDISIQVDTLHHSRNIYNVGDFVSMEIQKNDIVHLEKDEAMNVRAI